DWLGVRNYLTSHVAACLRLFVSGPPPQNAFFDPPTTILFLLGAGWVLWRWRDPRHLTIAVWTIGILVMGGMITDYPPEKARMIGFLPALYVVPALVVGRVRALLWRYA